MDSPTSSSTFAFSVSHVLENTEYQLSDIIRDLSVIIERFEEVGDRDYHAQTFKDVVGALSLVRYRLSSKTGEWRNYAINRRNDEIDIRF